MRVVLLAATALLPMLLLAGCADDGPSLSIQVQGIPADDASARIVATLELPKATMYHDQGCGDQPVKAWVALDARPATRLSHRLFPPEGRLATGCVEQDILVPRGRHTWTFEWNGRDAAGTRAAPGQHDLLVAALAGRIQVHDTVHVA